MIWTLAQLKQLLPGVNLIKLSQVLFTSLAICYRVWKQQLHILSFIKVTPWNKAANNIKQVPSNGQGSLPTFSKYGKHQLVMKN